MFKNLKTLFLTLFTAAAVALPYSAFATDVFNVDVDVSSVAHDVAFEDETSAVGPNIYAAQNVDINRVKFTFEINKFWSDGTYVGPVNIYADLDAVFGAGNYRVANVPFSQTGFALNYNSNYTGSPTNGSTLSPGHLLASSVAPHIGSDGNPKIIELNVDVLYVRGTDMSFGGETANFNFVFDNLDLSGAAVDPAATGNINLVEHPRVAVMKRVDAPSCAYTTATSNCTGDMFVDYPVQDGLYDGVATANGDGTYNITFEAHVFNFGDVDLGEIEVIDNLTSVFGTYVPYSFPNPPTLNVGEYMVFPSTLQNSNALENISEYESGASYYINPITGSVPSTASTANTSLNVNTNFTGSGAQVLASGATGFGNYDLGAYDNRAVRYTIRFNPGDSNWDCNVPQYYNNILQLNGDAQANNAEYDNSMAGARVAVVKPCYNPEIDITKEAIVDQSGPDPVVTFTITAENIGDVDLTNVVINDNLDNVFGTGYYTINSYSAEVQDASDGSVLVPNIVNSGYDGTAINQDIVSGFPLGTGQQIVATIVVTIDNVSNGPNYVNETLVTVDELQGLPPVQEPFIVAVNDLVVTKDVVSVTQIPNIVEFEDLSTSTIGDIGASYEGEINHVVYEINIENQGNTDLTNIEVFDNLDNVFGADNYAVVGYTSSASTQQPYVPWVPNNNYDGSLNNALLGSAVTLPVGGVITLSFAVDVYYVEDVTTGYAGETVINEVEVTSDQIPSTIITANTDLVEHPNLAVMKRTNAPSCDDTTQQGCEGDVFIPYQPGSSAYAGQATANADGSYSVEFEIQIYNYGDVDIENVGVKDEIAGFGNYNPTNNINNLNAGEYMVEVDAMPILEYVNPNTNTNITTNTNQFNGVPSSSVTPNSVYVMGDALNSSAGVNVVASGDTYAARFTIRFKPPANTTSCQVLNYTNQTSAANAARTVTGNNSTVHIDAIAPCYEPAIGLAKQYYDPAGSGGTPVDNVGPAEAIDNGDGTFTMNYVFPFENTGDADISNIYLEDDLSAFGAYVLQTSGYPAAPGEYIVSDNNPYVVGASSGVAVHSYNNGIHTLDLPGAVLEPGETGYVTLSVTFMPTSGQLPGNSATIYGEGEAGSGPVQDTSNSDNSSTPIVSTDPNGNTPLNPPADLDDSFNATKVVASPVSYPNGVGAPAQITYQINLSNPGQIIQSGVSVEDNLSSVFGQYVNSVAALDVNNPAAQYYVETSVYSGPAALPNPLVANPAFDGQNDIELLDTAQGLLYPDSYYTNNSALTPYITVTVYFVNYDPNNAGGANYCNTITATSAAGNVPSTSTVCDRTEPNAVTEKATDIQIDANGALTAQFTVTYTNTGSNDLTNVTISDDLTAPFPNGYSSATIVSAELINMTNNVISQIPGAINTNYTGDPNNPSPNGAVLVSGIDVHQNYQVVIVIDVAVDPEDVVPGSYTNTAVGESDQIPGGTPGDDTFVIEGSWIRSVKSVDLQYLGWCDNSGRKYKAIYEIGVKNVGAIDLNAVTVTDNLTNEFGAYTANPTQPNQYYVDNLRSGAAFNAYLNSNFNGDSNQVLVQPSGNNPSLAPNQEEVVGFDVLFCADLSATTVYSNQAEVAAESSVPDGNGVFTVFTDLSDEVESMLNAPYDPNGDDPTILDLDTESIANIGISKAYSALELVDPAANRYKVIYTLRVENLSTNGEQFRLFGVTDDLVPEFGTNVAGSPTNAGEYNVTNTQFVAGTPQYGLSVNSNYQGVSPNNEVIAWGSAGSFNNVAGQANNFLFIQITLDFIPSLGQTQFANQAAATIQQFDDSYNNNDQYTDLSNDASYNPNGTFVLDVDENDNGYADDITPDEGEPTIFNIVNNVDVAANKQFRDGPNCDLTTGWCNATFVITATNNGDNPISIAIEDDLAAPSAFGDPANFDLPNLSSTLCVESPSGDQWTVNANYTGFGNNTVIAQGMLASGSSVDCVLEVNFLVTTGSEVNTATIGWSIPNSNQNGEVDADLPIGVTPLDPRIGVAKQANVNTNQIEFIFTIQNYSPAIITDLSLTENLDNTFATLLASGGGYNVTSCVISNNSTVATPPTVCDSTFDGSTNTNIFEVPGPTLQPSGNGSGGDEIIVTLRVELSGEYGGTYINTVLVEGTDPNGNPVQDTSTDGANPDYNDDGDPTNDNDGDPTNNNDDTEFTVDNPTPLSLDQVNVTKTSMTHNATIGDVVVYTLTLENNGPDISSAFMLVDSLPFGLSYVAGSSSISPEPSIVGQDIIWTIPSIGANATLDVTFAVIVNVGAPLGAMTNIAFATNDDGVTSNIGTHTIIIEADPIFDCATIIGKVFDDMNQNGYQDPGEPGIPGARLATVNGLLIDVDPYGRYHVDCASVPNHARGSNFILKLDERTLPTGYHVTSENPRVVRLTRGKVTKLNFGVALGRLVNIEIQDEFFDQYGQVPQEYMDQILAVLNEETSHLCITYATSVTDNITVDQRLKDFGDRVLAEAKARGLRRKLKIQREVVRKISGGIRGSGGGSYNNLGSGR